MILIEIQISQMVLQNEKNTYALLFDKILKIAKKIEMFVFEISLMMEYIRLKLTNLRENIYNSFGQKLTEA